MIPKHLEEIYLKKNKTSFEWAELLIYANPNAKNKIEIDNSFLVNYVLFSDATINKSMIQLKIGKYISENFDKINNVVNEVFAPEVQQQDALSGILSNIKNIKEDRKDAVN